MTVEYASFHKLRPGRIHLYCPKCGRKASNLQRAEHAAVLAHVWCERCINGGFDSSPVYLDARGHFLYWDDARGEYR